MQLKALGPIQPNRPTQPVEPIEVIEPMEPAETAKAIKPYRPEETVQLRVPIQRTAATENERSRATDTAGILDAFGTPEKSETSGISGIYAASEVNAADRIPGGETISLAPRPETRASRRARGARNKSNSENADASRPSRKAPRPSLRARLAADPRLAVVLGVLATLAARAAPYARRMKPEYPRPGRTGWRRWLPSWRQWIGGAFAGIGLSGCFLVVAYAATDIPDNLNSYATQQDNVYFWADGTPMARTGWVQRQEMPLEDIPEDVRWAVLAAENASFYSDPGISVKGISRAVLRTFGQGDTQGGSTITQQYVKNVYLNQDQTVRRKFTEAMMALKLDNRMSKDEILEAYLNTSWFGRGTYGIQRAAQAYYGKDVGELNASEAAFLAALLKGAGLYDPTLSQTNRDRAVERWSWTLDRMVAIGRLSPEERAGYKKFPEPLKNNPLYSTGEQSDYLVELASQYAKKAAKISDKQFDLGGYQIYTTFEKDRERRLTDVVTDARKKALEDDPKTAKTAHYGAASVAADGRILAVYGGPDYRKQGFNESNATTVPAGTAFTPFVYAAGLEHGVRTARDGATTPVTGESLYNGDDDVPVTTPEGPYWDRSGRKVAASNDGDRSYGQISLHRAMALSVNTPFMQLGMDTGLDKVRSTAVAAGLLPSSIGARVPALSMGSSTPSAIRMASGYATFAAEGRHTEPYSVLRITHNGTKLPLDAPQSRRAVGADVAEEVTSALTESFRTAHPDAAPLSEKVAGKAGTTEKDTAAWYVGTHESVSTAVVVYRIDLAKSLEPLPLKGIAGTADDSVPYGIWSGALGLAG
ncbi:transglycosylase domain-containing protein [Streptomyces sp. NPDC006610]|uniref:transglycosylase domain-containing protein n=1 Tax=Streptomyces sp. NPDC006610 TaxID=3154584 RepID=UPI0033AADAF9